MTPTRFARRAAACLALALPLALAGCGGSTPPASKGEEKPGGGGGPTATPVNPAATPPPASGPADDATTKAASDFLRTVGDGSVHAAAMSPNFLKVIGKPITFETDVAKGYSEDLAVMWVRRVGGGLSFGLPSGTTAGGAAVVSGSYRGPNREGRYAMRLVQEGGWKVDWFQLSSAPASAPTPSTGDAVFQQFAATAFLDALADKGNRQEDRIPLVANLLTPELRKEWASPSASDTKGGYDYAPNQIIIKFVEIGGVDGFTAGAVADLTVKGELTKAAGKKAFTLKLVKGTTPGQWFVSEFVQN